MNRLIILNDRNYTILLEIITPSEKKKKKKKLEKETYRVASRDAQFLFIYVL